MKRHNSYVNGVREVCANKTEPQRGCVSAVTCVDRAAYQGTCVHPGLVRVSSSKPGLQLLTSGMGGRREAPVDK